MYKWKKFEKYMTYKREKKKERRESLKNNNKDNQTIFSNLIIPCWEKLNFYKIFRFC